MNGARIQLECKFECNMIAMEVGHAVCEWWPYLAIHGAIAGTNVSIAIEMLRKWVVYGVQTGDYARNRIFACFIPFNRSWSITLTIILKCDSVKWVVYGVQTGDHARNGIVACFIPFNRSWSITLTIILKCDSVTQALQVTIERVISVIRYYNYLLRG